MERKKKLTIKQMQIRLKRYAESARIRKQKEWDNLYPIPPYWFNY